MLKTCQIIQFGKNIRPNLGASIFGTKCDRDNPIFSAKRGIQSDRDEI